MRVNEQSAAADASKAPVRAPAQAQLAVPAGPQMQRSKMAELIAADDEARKKADKRALLISGGIWLAGGVAGGMGNWGLHRALPNYGRAAEPVLNITTGVLQSPGGRFQENMVNPLRARVWSFAGQKAVENANPAGKIVYPKLLEEMVATNIVRNKLNGWQVGQLENLAAYARQMEITCHGARECLKAGDFEGASRRLAAGMVYDRSFWGEIQPQSTEIFELVYAGLYPYFARFDEKQLDGLRQMVRNEAQRLDSKDKGLAAYIDAIMTGLTKNQRPPQFVNPWKPSFVQPSEMQMQFMAAANDEGGAIETQKLINQYFDKLLEGKGWWARFKINRQRKRITKAVLKQIAAFEKEQGRAPSLDELWKVILRALKIDDGKRLENTISLMSLGMFAGFGAVSGIANMQLAKHVSKNVMAGLDAVVFALVGYAMGAAGSFFSDKFGSAGRALGYGGLKNLTIGSGIERELRDNLLKLFAVDRRMDAGRVPFITYQYFIEDQVTNAEAALKRGNLDQAAAFIGNTAWESRVMFYEYSPFMEVMRLLFMRLGPHFDGLSTAQRDELIAKATAYASKYNPTAWETDNYLKPFIVSMLTENVKLSDAPAPAPAPPTKM